MQKLIIGASVVAALLIALLLVVPAAAAGQGTLDHVVISPSGASVAAGAAQQFTARNQDSDNNNIPDLIHSWQVVAGGGSIDNNGLFKAGNVAGAFPNTVQYISVQDSIIKIAYASVTVLPAVLPGTLDHVVLSPRSSKMAAGAEQQFTARSQDSGNNNIPDLVHSWQVVAGGGSIDNNGLFKAGNVAGKFTNTVQYIAVQDGIIKTAYASVTVLPSEPDDESSPADETPQGWSKGNKNGWEGGIPPGWSSGNKTGWNEGIPPGLAKGKEKDDKD